VTTKPDHRGEHEGNRHTIVQGMPVAGFTCGDFARVLFSFAHEAMGAGFASGIPCALCLSRATSGKDSGISCRGNASLRALAKQSSFALEKCWIASSLSLPRNDAKVGKRVSRDDTRRQVCPQTIPDTKLTRKSIGRQAEPFDLTFKSVQTASIV
jgi:hypothetical protein